MKYLAFLFLLVANCEPSTSDPIKNFSFPEIDHLKLVGVITETDDLERASVHGYGIISMGIIESNVDFYNPRKTNSRYYISIDGDRAELYIYVGTKRAGDTVKIDMTAAKEFWYKNVRTKETLNYSPRLYNKKLHEFIDKNKLSKLHGN